MASCRRHRRRPTASSKAACRPRRSSPTCSSRNTPITYRLPPSPDPGARRHRIDRSTLRPLGRLRGLRARAAARALVAILKASTKLFADETRCPVLDPGRGKTKTGYLWAIARDDRPWGGSDPPAVAYMYAPGRGAEHACCAISPASPACCRSTAMPPTMRQTDAKRAGGPLVLAHCWSHFRRRFYDIAKAATRRSRARPAAHRALYAIEAEIRGRSADERRAERQARTRPLVDALRTWLEQQLPRVSRARPIAARRCATALSHWQGLCRFLDDGRIEIDRTMRSSAPSGRDRDDRVHCAPPIQVSGNIEIWFLESARHGRPFRARATATCSLSRSAARIWCGASGMIWLLAKIPALISLRT